MVTPQTAAQQAPLPVGFSRQEHWSELPFPSPGDLPNPRIKPRAPALQADSLPSEPPGKPWMSPVSVNSLRTQESQMELKYKPSVAKIKVLGCLYHL